MFFASVCTAQNINFDFETNEIEILEEGNVIKAKNAKAISKDKNIEITANYFKYLNDLEILEIEGNGFIWIKSDNLKINFDNGFIDQKNQIFEASGKIKAKDLDKSIIINSKKVNYNYKSNILSSKSKSYILDNYKNNFIVDSFIYELKKSLLKINNLELIDKDSNNFKTKIAYFNTKTNNLFGKDIALNLNEKLFNRDNQPRIKGNSIINNENETEITRGVFTSCKKRDGCPPWEISAEKIRHDKNNQTINYENALLKIYDKPVLYLPKFHHPDPTLKRKSGFLVPSLKNSSNRKNYLNLPYYLVISDNKDLTFSPRLYLGDEFLLQTEFRQVNKNSNHISDFSFKVDDYSKLSSHLFYSYDKEFNLDNFIETNLNFKVQKTSKDTYIRKNKIKSKILSDENFLENFLKVDFVTDKTTANISTVIYEDLNKEDNDRYEYIFPKVNLETQLNNNTKLNGDFIFKTEVQSKNYNTNVTESSNINDIIFTSFPKITKDGLYNNYEFIIKNSNTNSKNSSLFKNHESAYLSGLFQFNSSYPLAKNNQKFKKIINPRLSLKVAPKHTKNYKDDYLKLDVNNIYSLNRTKKNDSLEGGLSLTYGNDFSILKQEDSNELFNFKIANNLRFKDNNDLSNGSQISQKVSSILSEVSYIPNDKIKFNYNSSIRNDLDNINYENLTTEIKINNIVTSFEYFNENNSLNNNSYVSNTTKIILDESNNLSFSTRRNKISDLTEFYNLAYQYKNDCLQASIEYNKDYYSDKDIKPNESIFLKFAILPFDKNN